MANEGERSPAPGERIERTEVIEHTATHDTSSTRRTAPMWMWLLPLVAAAIVLAWYVFTEGEPNRPSIGEIELPGREIVEVEPAPDPIIVVPEVERVDPSADPAEPTSPSSEPNVGETSTDTPEPVEAP